MSAKPWVGQTVVIVDDSAGVREELKRSYEQIGMKVVGLAENGVEGIELYKKHRPYLVSLDVIMPEMDGVECYRKLKALDPEVRIVMVSWLANDPKVLENLKDVIPPYLFQSKPAPAAALETRLGILQSPPTPIKPGIKSTLDEDAAMMDLGVKVS